jgi:hypothetical protein
MSLGFGGQHSSQSQDYSSLLSQLFSQQGSQSGTTARVLTPEQQQAQTQLTQTIHALATNPQQFLAPAQNQGRNDVNDNYSGLADSLRQQFLGTPGGGGSGKYGSAALQGDLARRKQLSDVDSSFAQQGAMLPVTAAGLSQNLLGMNMGQTSTGSTSTSGSSTQTGSGHSEGSGTEFGGSAKI